MNSDPKDAASLVAYYAAQTGTLYEKLAEKMNDSLQQQPGDLLIIGTRQQESRSPLQMLKKQRIAKEFSQCLDAILDQTEFLYNVGNAAYNNYEAAFTVLSSAVPESSVPLVSRKVPKYMEPLQSISASALMPPVPTPAENLIRSVETLPPPLPTIKQSLIGSLQLPLSSAFELTPIINSSPDMNRKSNQP